MFEADALEILMPPLTVEVLPATVEWAYPDIEADFKARRYVWREVSKDFYWQALGVLPPVMLRGGFLVGEPWSHNANGEELCAAFTEVGGRCFATISTASGFAARRDGLLAALPAYLATRSARVMLNTQEHAEVMAR